MDFDVIVKSTRLPELLLANLESEKKKNEFNSMQFTLVESFDSTYCTFKWLFARMNFCVIS